MSAIDLRCCPRDCWQMNTHHTALRHYAGQIGPSEPLCRTAGADITEPLEPAGGPHRGRPAQRFSDPAATHIEGKNP